MVIVSRNPKNKPKIAKKSFNLEKSPTSHPRGRAWQITWFFAWKYTHCVAVGFKPLASCVAPLTTPFPKVIETYNFDIKLVFIQPCLKKLWMLLCCSMVIIALSYDELAVKTVFTADLYDEVAVMRSPSSLPVGDTNQRS